MANPWGAPGPGPPGHRRRQKTPGRVRHAPRSPPAAARGGRPTRGGSYVHAVRRAAWRRQPRVKGAGDPRFWFAIRTGCERRTLGRPPSCQDVLRCARSAGREERRQGGGLRQARGVRASPEFAHRAGVKRGLTLCHPLVTAHGEQTIQRDDNSATAPGRGAALGAGTWVSFRPHGVLTREPVRGSTLFARGRGRPPCRATSDHAR